MTIATDSRGIAQQVNLTRAAAGDDVFKSRVSGDAYPRFTIDADGKHEWGTGAAVPDVNLYRGGANYLKTDDSLHVGGWAIIESNLYNRGTIFFGSAEDTNLYRSATDALKTDDNFYVGGNIQFSPNGWISLSQNNGNGHISLVEQGSAPGVTSETGKLFCEDNGSGKTRLCIRFNTGAVQVIATEP